MRKRAYLAVFMALVLLLTGCSSKEKYELRQNGILRMNAGNYPAAVQLFDEALEKSDGRVGSFELDVLKYRAEAEYRMGDYGAAAATYDTLWQVDGEKKKMEYLSRCCAMLILDGQLDTAKEQYQVLYGAAQADDGDVTELLLALGTALREANRGSEAMELFQQAVDDGVQNGELYNQLALNEMEFEEYDQALAFIEKGLAVGDGAREKLLFNQAVAYEKKLDFAGALQTLEAYAGEFGSSQEIEKEIAFLKTRAD